ncbi:hypothetical protein [Parathalassolituus penaei]|uniref:Uncharacterized protein n=1 Tax=Parathalassolituus penaei TaxID=2997323 RepID=A0A9X3EHX0_9GAMM|nr:hypothetical protein [Parathalassolituus penaei]MCY0964546.1 hypothetical protein [Parathalassolituus penaei]
MPIPVSVPLDPLEGWQVLDDLILDALTRRGATGVLIEEVRSRMKLAWDAHCFEHVLDVDEAVLDSVVQLQNAMQAYVTHLLFDRLLLEIELARLRGLR